MYRQASRAIQSSWKVRSNSSLTLTTLSKTGLKNGSKIGWLSHDGIRKMSSNTLKDADKESTSSLFNDNNGIVDMMKEVARQQQENIVRMTPWFFKNMPASYFKTVPSEIRIKHLRAITSVNNDDDEGLNLSLRTFVAEDDTVVITKISNATKVGSLHEQLKEITLEGHYLDYVNIFSSNDDTIALNMFGFAKRDTRQTKKPQESEMNPINDYIEDLKAGKYRDDPHAPEYTEELLGKGAMGTYSQLLTQKYVESMVRHPKRFLSHKVMYDKAKGNDASVVNIETNIDITNGVKTHWISIASGNVIPEALLRLSSRILKAKKMKIKEALMNIVQDPLNNTTEQPGSVSILQLGVECNALGNGDQSSREFEEQLVRLLKRSKWLDDKALDLGIETKLGLDRAEVITALCSLMHSVVHQHNPQAYTTTTSVLESITNKPHHMGIAESLADLYLNRFDPKGPLTESEFIAGCAKIEKKVEVLQFAGARLVLSHILLAVKSVLRTNFFHAERYALSMRVDPRLMFPSAGEVEKSKSGWNIVCTQQGKETTRPLPYGLFFVTARHFSAFHCRFRDIARGGLRLVTPPDAGQHAYESTRLFEEVHGLSYGQQLKNKDIPEGGAKGVILVNTPNIKEAERDFAMRKSVKGFTDAMLDLMVKDSVADLVDYYGKEELIYFGPDEQIINTDIDWITKRAAERGYPFPNACMSSKKDAGFNHKQYGVTSEGVAVYLDVALRRSLNINPDTDEFTIKITGGPDGDVAGNLIKVLAREYGNNCKVVGIADGFGVAEDPNGLDMQELLRLVEDGAPITKFDVKKLSPTGVSLVADNEEGITRRNSMFYRVQADAFVPAGGRPHTLNIENYKLYFDQETGKPSSPLIVEGANIFITQEARLKLYEEAGVSIVKDSSANKCGVITSSIEIAASMLLSKEEFIFNKEELVKDMMVLLREKARLEGELMFRSYKNYPGNLPHFSERISFAIGKVTDGLIDILADVELNDPLFQELQPLILENLPKKLVEIAGDRVSTHMPVQYQRNAIASALASLFVYQEGIHMVEVQPEEFVAQRAIEYFRAGKTVSELVARLESSGNSENEDHKRTVELLKKGGARSLVGYY